MTTLQACELTCPVCVVTFRSQAVLSTNSFGGKRTDFYARAVGNQPLPYQVHTCQRCGFSGPDTAFEKPLDPLLKTQLFEELDALRVRSNLLLTALKGSEKYELAALTAKLLGREEVVQADLLLKAAWCCVEEGDTEAERYFRIQAAETFTDALRERFGNVADDHRATYTYLVGELWRRAGFQQRAVEWFDHVADEVVDLKTQQWLIDAAKQQRDCPREWFG